jgi:hypothetical protein
MNVNSSFNFLILVVRSSRVSWIETRRSFRMIMIANNYPSLVIEEVFIFLSHFILVHTLCFH